MDKRSPSAFISYSWEDNEHKAWVREFSTRLRTQGGVDVKLDQWHAGLGIHLSEFMERAVRENDFVLIICTPQYRQKSDARQGGVGIEGHIMTAEILTDANHSKFIPILRKGKWNDASPSWLRGKIYSDLRGNPYSEEFYFHLLKVLHGAVPLPPPLGPPPVFHREGINLGESYRADNLGVRPQMLSTEGLRGDLKQIQMILRSGSDAEIKAAIERALLRVPLTSAGNQRSILSAAEQVILTLYKLGSDGSDRQQAIRQCRRLSIELFGQADAGDDIRSHASFMVTQALASEKPPIFGVEPSEEQTPQGANRDVSHPGNSLYQDLARANEDLESLLRPIGGAIGELWLDKPAEKCWFPYRPDSIAHWDPSEGTWRDHSVALGIINWELTIQAMHPQICFMWTPKSEPWPAICDPYEDPDAVSFCLDGLLYVKNQATRLFECLALRLHHLYKAGLLPDFLRYENQLALLCARFSQAGDS